MRYYVLDTTSATWLIDKKDIRWTIDIAKATSFSQKEAYDIFLQGLKDNDSIAIVREKDIILAKMGLPA